MTIREAIEKMSTQFSFEPRIENGGERDQRTKFCVLGVGGSSWPANLVKAYDESLHIRQHRDYGLPAIPERERAEYRYCAVSYSGNTEETISGYEDALREKCSTIAISIGGKLLRIANANASPSIALPDYGLQPRAATGLMLRALLKALGHDRGYEELGGLASTFHPKSYEAAGKQLATQHEGFVPVIYASRRNAAIAQVWKVKLNECGKIPAFFHVFPELNHNEMTGFDATPRTRALSEKFRWIFLSDEEDDPRVQKRFMLTERLLRDRGHHITSVPLAGETRWHRIFGSLATADWFSLFTAEHYGIDPTAIPMVDELKRLMA
jgi:glucose/mannose-6-phosphate isomerase